MTERFTSDVCRLLAIPTPEISFDTSHFPTEFMRAQCDSVGSTIYIRKEEDTAPDQMFAIAHELRHVWQLTYHKDYYFAQYRTYDQCRDMEDYNLQPAEVDANAFAGLAMMGYFELRPLYVSMPESVKKRINERLDELMKEYAA